MVNNHEIIDKCKALYTAFDTEAIGRLAEIYHPDVRFTDPIHAVEGLHALTQYFQHVCDGSDSQFEFTATVVQGEQAFLRWVMHYSNPKLAGGKALALSGGSFLTLDEGAGRIIAQEDYYDMGQMVYRHLPVIGWAIQKINHHLAGTAASTGRAFSARLDGSRYAK
ncbi:nuclear transport factor 2 family protein [Marinagarivorans algicola]|uniref:nuclear transport factor 2 family protein n=1 Tax=Marinagarivorans algicola TaxID=1513270 RepID=UPI0006B48958|nr:nuclear transport factor 2 family protein [Marinagarivorans algicola]